MKEYLFLYKEFNDRYYNLEKYPLSLLRYLRTYLSGDDRYYDENLFIDDQSHYNEIIIVNDLKNKIFHIVVKDFDIENHIPDDDRHELTNEFNSCKISHDNFIEFRKKWLVIKEILPEFAIIYRDDNDWVDCKGFDSKEEMELFVTTYKTEVMH